MQALIWAGHSVSEASLDEIVMPFQRGMAISQT